VCWRGSRQSASGKAPPEKSLVRRQSRKSTACLRAYGLPHTEGYRARDVYGAGPDAFLAPWPGGGRLRSARYRSMLLSYLSQCRLRAGPALLRRAAFTAPCRRDHGFTRRQQTATTINNRSIRSCASSLQPRQRLPPLVRDPQRHDLHRLAARAGTLRCRGGEAGAVLNSMTYVPSSFGP
jgi:hypothetical protein